MTGHGAKFSRKKEEAIAALVSQRNAEEAARAIGIAPQTLYRWLKIPEFETAYREAREALSSQALARLQKASGAAVTILLRIMYDQSAPRTARLKAAELVLDSVKDAVAAEEVGARLRRLKQGRQSKPGRHASITPPADQKPRAAGHGGKFGRKKEQAITGLLTQRNIEEAARYAGIGTTTLYRWLKDPAFQAAYREARVTAFAQAGARLQQAAGPAVTTILNIMVESGASPAAQVRACALVLKRATGGSERDIEAWLRESRDFRGTSPPGHGPAPREVGRGQPKAA
jgi:DNA invertase Pin-like site-specific DNA recombinase